jgi:hypothetical protein
VWIAVKLLREEFLNLLHHFHKPVHLGLGVVEIKTCAGGGFDAELVHERLRGAGHGDQLEHRFKSSGSKMPVVCECFGNAQPPHYHERDMIHNSRRVRFAALIILSG